MSRVRVNNFSVSIEGYGAGPEQGPNDPLGRGGLSLHEWLFAARRNQEMVGQDTGRSGIDDRFAARGMDNLGSWILGRNMFGPIRGPWPDETWKGWWGNNPPFHVPVYVLTHHARTPIEMEGGTTFNFVTGGIHEALKLAKDAAGQKDVLIGGGVATIRQYLRAGLIDEVHLALVPILLGSGEHLLQGIDLLELGYRCTEHLPTERATHVVLSK